MTVVGKPRNYDKRFLFAVEIDGLEISWFESCSDLEAELGLIEQREGGSIIAADESLGLAKFPAITLAVGATDNREMYDWWELCLNAAANTGAPDADCRKNVSIVQKDRDGSEKGRYDLFEVLMTKFKAGAWDAKAEENVIQECVLKPRYWLKG